MCGEVRGGALLVYLYILKMPILQILPAVDFILLHHDGAPKVALHCFIELVLYEAIAYKKVRNATILMFPFNLHSNLF